MAKSKTEIKKYELGYLLSPLIPADDLEAVVQDQIVALVIGLGGEVTASPVPVMKNLAYPVKKDSGNKRANFKDAYFGYIHFTLNPSNITKFNESLTKVDAILRVLLIIAIKTVGKKPAITTSAKEESKVSQPSEKNTPAKPEVREGAKQEEIDREIEGLLSPVQ